MTLPVLRAGAATFVPGSASIKNPNPVHPASENLSRTLALFALALGSFCIGTSEFASMGIIQLFSASLGISVSQATNAVTAYALGVVLSH
jgi:DHA1 family inner membrane transport protein